MTNIHTCQSEAQLTTPSINAIYKIKPGYLSSCQVEVVHQSEQYLQRNRMN